MCDWILGRIQSRIPFFVSFGGQPKMIAFPEIIFPWVLSLFHSQNCGWPTVLLAAKTYANDPLKRAISTGLCTFEG